MLLFLTSDVDNADDGLKVGMRSKLAMKGGDISGNGCHGLVLLEAATVTKLDSVTINNNAQVGLAMTGMSWLAEAVGCTVKGNQAAGMLVVGMS